MLKSQLLYALDVVKPGLATRELIPQTTAFAFMNGRVVTYNDEISISFPLEGLDIEGVIQAKELHGLLNKVKKDEMEMEIVDNVLTVKSGKMAAGLTLEDKNRLPLEQITERGDWIDLPEDFCKVLKLVMPASSKDMSTPVLTAVHIDNDMLEASDGHRILRYYMEEGLELGHFLLPVEAGLEVVKMNPIKVAHSKGWVHFITYEESIISCRTMEEKYPAGVSHILKMEGVRVTLPNNLAEILERAMVFSKRDHLLDESVTIKISHRKVTVKSNTKGNKAWFEESANMRYTGDDITFHMHPYLLYDILERTSTCIVGKEKLKFSGDNWEYVMILLTKKKD